MTLKKDVMKEYLKKCVRCGQCRYVCPVLAEAGKESAAPRGKLFLAGMLQRGEIKPGPQPEIILSLCLACGACTAECPSGLPVDDIITAARAHCSKSRPYSPYRFIYRQSFLRQHLISKFPGAARSRIPLTTGRKKRSPGLRVGYFLGCATNYILPKVAISTVAVLKHLGCEVVTPPFRCCGLPLAAAGETDAAARLLNFNRQLIKEYQLDTVVTDCSSCSHHLTGGDLSGNSRPVYEFGEFLVNVVNPPKPGGELDGSSVACHDPCHLRFGRRLSGLSRQIISIIPGIKAVDVPGGSACCGGGGTFSLRHRNLSAGILRRNTDKIISSGAQKAATACPSCMIQLGREIPVCHPAQLLRESYGLT